MAAWLDRIKQALSPARKDENDDRRRTVRVKCRIGVVWRVGEKMIQGTALDLSARGMRVEFKGVVRRGELVAISRMSVVGSAMREPVRSIVRWVRQQEKSGLLQFGVEFSDEPEAVRRSWIQACLKEGPGSAVTTAASFRQRRRHRRIPCSILSEVWNEFQEKITDGVVTDLSLGGAGVMLTEKAPVGMVLDLHVGPVEDLGVLELRTRVLTARETTIETRRGPRRRFCHGVVFAELRASQKRHLLRFLRMLEVRVTRK